MTRVLVTGSEGSLMRWVIPRLLARGHSVLGVDRVPVRAGKRPYAVEVADLTDLDAARTVVGRVDAVIQAAAQIYGVGGFHAHPADILADDVTVHRNILTAAKEAGVGHVVYVSSSMVYERAETHPVAEADAETAQAPATAYGLSKLVGERLSRAFHEQHGVAHTIWRPFNIVTPEEAGAGEIGVSHVFADFITNIVSRRRDPLPIIGDGHQVRCFTWIGDVAEAIAAHLDDPAARGETINLGNPEPITMRELAAMIRRTAAEVGLLPPAEPGEPRVETVRDYPTDVRQRVPEIAKARRVLGWAPTVSTAAAIRRCLTARVPDGEAAPPRAG